jgi:carboxyl-terminal processing protease
MQDPKDRLPEIPDVKLPDPTSPAYRRTGMLLAGLAGALTMCCVILLGAGLALGAINISGAGQPRGIAGVNLPPPTADPLRGADLTRGAPSVTATPEIDMSAPVATDPTAPAEPVTPVEPTPLNAPEATPEAPAPTPVPEATPTTPPATVVAVREPTAAPTAAPIVNVPRDVTETQLRIFDAFWETINTAYLYPDFQGVDWAATKVEARARIAQGMDETAFYGFLDDLVERLGDDHSHYLSPKGARDEDQEYNGTFEFVGVGIITEANMDKGHISILQVLADSPASRAGLKAHDHILEIDGQPIIDAEGNVTSGRFRGTPGSQVTALVRSPGGEPRAITMTRATINSKERVEYRLLEAGGKRYGYVLIPTLFEEDIDERVASALRALGSRGALDGLIVDMRINGGGALNVLEPTLGLFTRGEAGRLVGRKGSRQAIGVRAVNIVNSQRLPLAVLIGPSTESYAEVFAGVLQAKGRAKLIGLESAGNIETLRAHEFEDGSRLWLAEEGFRLPDGSSWEGKGLVPDVRVTARWDEFDTENDPVIAAAIKTLAEN